MRRKTLSSSFQAFHLNITKSFSMISNFSFSLDENAKLIIQKWSKLSDKKNVQAARKGWKFLFEKTRICETQT